MSFQTIFHIAAKTTLWVLFLVIAVVCFWFAANRFLDESPHSERESFLVSAQDQIPDNQNIAVGLLGLIAPEGSNFIDYGSEIAALLRIPPNLLQIEEKLRGPGTLQLTVDSNQVMCWLDPYVPKSKDCLPFEQAPEILEQNWELLERYRSLHKLSRYSNLYLYHYRDLGTILMLVAADVHLRLERGEYEAAYELWRDQLQFSKKMLAGTDGWVGKAMGLVVFGFTLPLLENIILANPELAVKHEKRLNSLLQIDGIDAFNLEGILRAEYSVLNQWLKSPPSPDRVWINDRLHRFVFYLGQEQRILNRYHAFAADYAQVLRLPWSQVDEEMSRLEEKYIQSPDWKLLIDPFGAVLLRDYFEGQLKAREMLKSMHRADGRLRLASLFIRIINADVDDKEIPGLIEAAGSAYYNPFSKGPMKWDPEKRRIYFPDQSNECAMFESFCIPDSKNGGSLSTSRADASLC